MTGRFAMKINLPIWRDANRLLLSVERVVRRFPRYHKYTLGSELRQQAMLICRLIHRAWRERQWVCRWLLRLVRAIDDLKLQLQLAKELALFQHFAEFEQLAGLAVEVGKQSGGWLRRTQASPPESGRGVPGVC